MSERLPDRVAVGSEPFAIMCHREGDTAHISVTGELDIATAPQMRAQCEHEHLGDAGTILVDLSCVTFMDTAGLRTLFAAHNASGKRLQIILSAPSARIIDVTDIRDKLPIIEG